MTEYGFYSNLQAGLFYFSLLFDTSDSDSIIGPGSSDSQEMIETISRHLSFPVRDVLESPFQVQFFCHFVNAMPHILTVPLDSDDQDDDPIMSVIVPMSVKDPMILKALLCVGASHLINCMPLGPDTDIRTLMANEKQRLLLEAGKRLASRAADLRDMQIIGTVQKGDYEALLAGYLLLYLFDLSEGTGDGSWQLRLDGARDIIFEALGKHQGDNDDQGPSREELEDLGFDQFLIEFFIYHDILASVTAQRPRKSLISGSGDALMEEDRQEYMLGMDNGLIDFIGRIAILRSDAATALSAPGIAQAVCIWQDIDKWRPFDANRDSELSSSYCDIYEAYIAACFIWLFSILHPGSLADDKVQTMVRKGLESLLSMQIPCLLSFALYPVFVLGIACTGQEDRKVIEDQLEKIEKFRRFRNVQVCRSIIKDSWAAYDAGKTQSWNWIHLMKAQGVRVSVA